MLEKTCLWHRQTGANTLWIVKCSGARLCLALTLAAAFSVMSKEKRGERAAVADLLKARFAVCWMRLAGDSAVVCVILLGFDFSGQVRRSAVGYRNRWL